MLQALFEYQSLMAELTQMDVVNASLYDGATALAEAVFMAKRITKKREVLISRAISWEKKSVLATYLKNTGMVMKEIPYEAETGKVDLSSLQKAVGTDTAAFYLENPSFFGVLDDQIDEIRDILGKSIFIVGVNPLSLAVVRPPGDYGADIVVAEGQPLGLPMNFGGPLLGIFAARKEHMRKMPGRLVGMTYDADGRRAFCITLQTREQHIRRDRATSNICSNESLCALAAAVYLSLLGAEGLQRLALKNMEIAKNLSNAIACLDGIEAPVFNAPHFNEFTVRFPDLERYQSALLNLGIMAGIPLKQHYPELGECALFAVTERITEGDIIRLRDALRSVGGSA